jgi:hypothetical protein
MSARSIIPRNAGVVNGDRDAQRRTAGCWLLNSGIHWIDPANTGLQVRQVVAQTAVASERRRDAATKLAKIH